MVKLLLAARPEAASLRGFCQSKQASTAKISQRRAPVPAYTCFVANGDRSRVGVSGSVCQNRRQDQVQLGRHIELKQGGEDIMHIFLPS